MSRLLKTRLGRSLVNRFYGTPVWNMLRDLASALGLTRTTLTRTERRARQTHDLAQSRVIAGFETQTAQMANGEAHDRAQSRVIASFKAQTAQMDNGDQQP